MRLRFFAHSQAILCLSILLLAGCVSLPETVPPTATVPAARPVEAYFTDPSAVEARGYEGGPAAALAAAIDAAHSSVDVAVYNLDLWSIRDALVRAARRGAVVRVVVESDNLDGPEIQDLVAAGIPVLGDRREGLMHDKFVVLDRSEVWTGSMNFTLGGAYWDDNNLLRIRSSLLAENYTAEFEEMFVLDLFGQDVRPATPHPDLNIDGLRILTYFSPDDGVAARLEALIRQARESVYFLAYSFTANDLGQALRDQAAAGLTVEGVMDAGQVVSNQGSEYDPFLQAGLDVRLDGGEGLMHHKVIVIDRSLVVTGSYNFSASAEERNDENLLVLYDPQLAEAYLAEFERLYALAPPGP